MRERPAELLRARWAAGWAGRLRALRRPGLTGKTESQEDSGQRGQLAGSVTHRGLGRSSAAPPESPATVLGGCFWLEPGLRFEFRNGKKKQCPSSRPRGGKRAACLGVSAPVSRLGRTQGRAPAHSDARLLQNAAARHTQHPVLPGVRAPGGPIKRTQRMNRPPSRI